MATLNGATDVSDGVESITQKGFKVSTRKLPILKAGPIEDMTEKLGITVPEMIFGDNYVRVEHVKSGWGIEFNTFDALDRVDKTGDKMLKVSYSKEWQDNRQHVHSDIKEVIKPFDWSYTTGYNGTLLPSDSSLPSFSSSAQGLPVQLLMRRDPLLFVGTTDLFEDELADNGMSIFTVKYRVMPDRLLVLARFFLRLDGVIFRIFDTRIYAEFSTGEIIREHLEREENYDTVKSKIGNRDDIASVMRQPDLLLELCPIIKTTRERLELPV
ncbi:TIP41-domain-containing protein [Microthyrium microscopicum]|uniref:TIP41-domain-containing protein n=1 Tax=Microthyrium microscopicum TaxID=703497 RepID=A0A6A6UPP6_9PEZI|nr:TIP41-domain-containing protein [Microthyrium microscopicum]